MIKSPYSFEGKIDTLTVLNNKSIKKNESTDNNKQITMEESIQSYEQEIR